MRKGYKPITSDLREQAQTLIDKNGLAHISRETGLGNATVYRLIRGESKTMSPKNERALRKYIQKFRNSKPHKPAKGKRAKGKRAKRSATTVKTTLEAGLCVTVKGSLVCIRALRHQGDHQAQNGTSWPRHFVHLGKQATDAVVLAFQLSLTAEQASQLLNGCHSQNCSPEAWLNQLVREKL